MMKPNSIIQDGDQRQQALDPQHSFIVQAPAGSGKTELLTQRFLVLLNCVKSPEEVLAITFTKRSAEEMRARIINALNNAHQNPEPTASHEKHTWRLAKNALQQDKNLHWNLLHNPNRLRIQTIDALNASLTRQLPILAQFGATPDIIDNPTFLYREAIQELLTHLEENVSWSDSIAQLLVHLDNDLNKVEDLLMNMLAKRDQWLPYIALNANHDAAWRNSLETSLQAIISDTLQQLCDIFPKQYQDELLLLLRYARQYFQLPDITQFPGHAIHDKATWQAIARLLLTDKYEWRKRLNKNQGFPAAGEAKNSAEKDLFNTMKQRAETLIQQLSSHENLPQAFQVLEVAPDATYEETQWQTLRALHEVLRIAVAQLKIIFQLHGKIDYIENSLAALLALGTADDPTDLALALDYKIQHILIDEFQDTSNNQFRLIEKLTGGWHPDDGRSLFVVGDPMQSIYRFREAEVGLFIRARQDGIGHIKLQPLTLTVNFRSHAPLVEWVNEHFTHVLPALDDVATGAVSFSPSVAHQASTDLPTGVLLHYFDAAQDTQAQAIMLHILAIRQKYPGDSIALLVRSRSHLTSIMSALKTAHIPYCAIDIDPLATRPVIQDVLALTRALLHPADRVAWLAILRAPWCGLTLPDLLKLCNDGGQQLIWQQLQRDDLLSHLSPEGQLRLLRLRPILQAKLYERGRHTLRLWVESTWLLLGGPACVEQLSDLDDVKAFFNLLDEWDQGGDVSIDQIQESMQHLYATPRTPTADALQIMTIHTAKGLEFDHVIIPHLEREASRDKKQLMLWMEQPRQRADSHLILAPVHAIGEEKDATHEYIKYQHNIKSNYEMGRLLYVAVTRAKRSLRLYISLKEAREPAKNSLLGKLWPTIQKTAPDHFTSDGSTPTITHAPLTSRLKRLTLAWKNPITETHLVEKISHHQKMPGFQLSQNTAKLIGVVIHQIFQQLCRFSVTWWHSLKPQEKKSYIMQHLQQLGIVLTDLDTATETVFTAINNALQDPRGQWIFHPHALAQAELPITTVIQQEIHAFIIDRTFVDDKDTRWIIDYKSNFFAGGNTEKFLDDEQEIYAKQLQNYSHAIRSIDDRRIRLGLYFPLIPAWREWEP